MIYFECERLDDVVAQLKQQGIAFDADPQDQSWLWREAYLRDPDGNVICLYWAGENRLNPPWRINRE
ncbi:MAG: VOC family protein [Blastocatellia bacterium]